MAGTYKGRPVGSIADLEAQLAAAGLKTKIKRWSIVKRKPYGRILLKETLPDGRVRYLHATKGWRYMRA